MTPGTIRPHLVGTLFNIEHLQGCASALRYTMLPVCGVCVNATSCKLARKHLESAPVCKLKSKLTVSQSVAQTSNTSNLIPFAVLLLQASGKVMLTLTDELHVDEISILHVLISACIACIVF